MSSELIGVIAIIVLFVLLAGRVYIGMAMMIVGFVGTAFLVDFESAMNLLALLPMDESRAYGMSVIPLFILMGQFAFVSGMSTDIYKTLYTWIGHLKGGLAMATVMACAFFAAVSGSSLATGATMGMVAIPEMRKFKYDMKLATGCVAAGGTLGILIPPSIGFVIYGIMTEQSVGKLLMAGLLPGIMLSGMFILAIYIQCLFNPALGPRGEKSSWSARIKSLSKTWQMLGLFALVIGGIYTGLFTPTEAAGIGAFGAFIITLAKRKITGKTLMFCLSETGVMTGFIFLIVIGAAVFSYFLALTGLPSTLSDVISSLPLPRAMILIAIIIVYLILGCVMEVYSIMILTLPIVFPIIQTLGFDPIWFGVMMVIILEVGLITPPIGLNVYILQGVAPGIKIEEVFKGIWPFFFMAILAMIIIAVFPQIALYIPTNM